ncbi:MAG: GNAT family N-acetyltransferase [Oleiphilus sp.]|nr:MAG: GNAT family N-acetyltransferase [Oleiphilus sp.]
MTQTTEETEARVVRLDPAALTEAKTILFHAYKNEPTFKYLFEYGRPGYEQRVRATIRELVSLHFETDQDVIGLALDNHLIAVALIGSPDVRLNLARQFTWRARMMMTAGMDCTWRYIDYHKQIHACLTDDLHHELPLFGVDDKYRNMGYGRKLMQAIENICMENPRSVGIALDTGNSRYLDFYSELGYSLVGEIRFGEITESVLFKPVAAARSQANG